MERSNFRGDLESHRLRQHHWNLCTVQDAKRAQPSSIKGAAHSWRRKNRLHVSSNPSHNVCGSFNQHVGGEFGAACKDWSRQKIKCVVPVICWGVGIHQELRQGCLIRPTLQGLRTTQCLPKRIWSTLQSHGCVNIPCSDYSPHNAGLSAYKALCRVMAPSISFAVTTDHTMPALAHTKHSAESWLWQYEVPFLR